MTIQEMLTGMAIECATWEEARTYAITELYMGNVVGWDTTTPNLVKNDWLAERERLLNKPSWDDAPERATHLSMDEGGRWAFCFNDGTDWRYAETGDEYIATLAIAIPAGYDWKESLEERPV